MKYIFAVAGLVISFFSFAQDSTHITGRVGEFTGRTLLLLKACSAPEEVATKFKTISDEIFSSAFPDESYQAYRDLYKKHYGQGESAAAEEFSKEKEHGTEGVLCEKVIDDARKAIAYYNAENDIMD